MPDTEGRTKAEETSTPLHAYKDGRAEDIQEGDMGVTPDGSKLPEGADEPGQYHDGTPGDPDDPKGLETAGPGSEEGVGERGTGTQTGAVQGPEHGGPGLGQEPAGSKPTRD